MCHSVHNNCKYGVFLHLFCVLSYLIRRLPEVTPDHGERGVRRQQLCVIASIIIVNIAYCCMFLSYLMHRLPEVASDDGELCVRLQRLCVKRRWAANGDSAAEKTG